MGELTDSAGDPTPKVAERVGYRAVRLPPEQRNLGQWLTENQDLNIVDNLTPDSIRSLAREKGLSLWTEVNASEGKLRRDLAMQMVSKFSSPRGDKYKEGEEPMEPFFIMVGRASIGFAGSMPDFPLSILVSEYESYPMNRIRVLRELYENYWLMPAS